MNDQSSGAPGPAEAVTRRKVLASAIGVLTALIAAVLGIPSVIGLLGRSAKSKTGRFMKAAELASLPLNQPVSLKYREMTERAYVRAAEIRDVWALRTAADKVTVYSPICPHLGCRYNWNPDAHEFMCPCHGSIWTVEGKVVGGPSPRPLDTLPVKVEGGMLYVEWEVFQIGTREKKVM